MNRFKVLLYGIFVLFIIPHLVACVDSQCLPADPDCNLESFYLSQQLAPRKAVLSGIYWVDFAGSNIYRMNPDGSNVSLPLSGLDGPIMITASSLSLYWAEQGSSNLIRTTDFSLSGITNLISGYTNPTGVYYDATSNALYFSENNTKSLLRYSLSDASITTIGSGLSGVGGIDYDPNLKLMFMASDAGDIIRFNLNDPDPNATKTSIITGLGTSPLIAAVNTSSQRVCWSAISGTGDLPCADYNGGSQSSLVTGISTQLAGLAFDSDNEYVYWCDFGNSKVQRARADGTEVTDLVTGYGTQGGLTLVYK